MSYSNINLNKGSVLMKRQNVDVGVFLLLLIIKFLLYSFHLGGLSAANPLLIASTLGSLLVLASLAIPLKGISRAIVLYFINLVLTLLIAADLVFFRYFSDVISMPVIMNAPLAASVKSSVASLLKVYDAAFFIDLIAGLPLIGYLFLKRTGYNRGLEVSRLRTAVATLLIGGALSSIGVGILHKGQPEILTSFYDRVYIVQNIGLLNFHVIDAYKYFQGRLGRQKGIADEEIETLRSFLDEHKASYNEGDKKKGTGKGKNLIVVQVEALQEFVINRSIGGREITPNLNKLIKESLYYNNFYCETAGGGTSDAEFMTNVSLYPVKEGAAYIRYSGNNYYSLPRRLKEEGYYSSVMHAYKAGFWNRSVMYETLGFDEYISRDDYINDEIIGMGLSDKSFFKQSLERIKNMPKPFYTFLITLTSHHPFNNDRRYYSDFDMEGIKDSFIGNYLEAIHYADEALGEFLHELEASGILQESVLVVYGDHFAIPKDKKQELSTLLGLKEMSEANWIKYKKMPLIIHLPGGISKTNGIACGGVDIMPTILNILGIKDELTPMLGSDLNNAKDGYAIFRNGSFIKDDILCFPSDGEAYSLTQDARVSFDDTAQDRAIVKNYLNWSDKMIEHNLVERVLMLK